MSVTFAGGRVGKELGTPSASGGLWLWGLHVSVPPGLSLGSETEVCYSGVLRTWLSQKYNLHFTPLISQMETEAQNGKALDQGHLARLEQGGRVGLTWSFPYFTFVF